MSFTSVFRLPSLIKACFQVFLLSLNMALILAFDTSTKGCSAALFDQEQCLAHAEAIEEGFVHAERLHLLVESLFEQTDRHFDALDAIAIGAGPGSYTGLRIGISAAKGYAFALEKPLIAIDSLAIMSESVYAQLKTDRHKTIGIFSAIDARRQEVYARVQNGVGELVMPSQALLLEEFDSLSLTRTFETIYVVGDANEKLKVFFADQLKQHDFRFLDAFPQALHMGKLALERYRVKDVVSTEYFEPNYLKEVYITPPKDPQ